MRYRHSQLEIVVNSLLLGLGLLVIGMWLGAVLRVWWIMIPFLLPQYLVDQVFGTFFSFHGSSLTELFFLVILPQWIYGYLLVYLYCKFFGKLKRKNA